MFRLSRAAHANITAAAKRIKEPAAALTAAVDAYNEALGVLRELVRAVETDWQSTWDKRSERWQESAAGQSAAEMITAWTALADDLEDIEVVLPDIEIPGDRMTLILSSKTLQPFALCWRLCGRPLAQSIGCALYDVEHLLSEGPDHLF
jgi:hypothetical protein